MFSKLNIIIIPTRDNIKSVIKFKTFNHYILLLLNKQNNHVFLSYYLNISDFEKHTFLLHRFYQCLKQFHLH